ncbi:MAG: class I SAM-dependent methyltransferase [Desulfobacterales bacterium]|nr:class I SAM-dependent methyltransferase [Desulfobacterales bacterium]
MKKAQTLRDHDKRRRFAAKMTDVLNYGALNLAMGIGYRLELFDGMDALGRPASLDAIAARAGLAPRYVKEWLGVMVSAGVVEISRDAEGEALYFLPPEHGDLTTRRAGSDNLGVYTQEIPLLIQCALEAVVQGFKTGQGVPYANYPRFQRFMGELADAKHQQVLVDIFLPSVGDGALLRQLEKGIRVCDLGCAEGLVLILMAEAFPRSDFTGIDISAEALEKARAEAARRHLGNIRFVHRDAASLANAADLTACFDYVTAFDAIHDQTHPLAALKGVHALLKPGGAFSMVDIAAGSRIEDNRDHPMGPFLYTVSLMHCLPVGLVDGGTGLGMMWGRERAIDLLREAGFEDVQVMPIPHDVFNLHYYCHKQGTVASETR